MPRYVADIPDLDLSEPVFRARETPTGEIVVEFLMGDNAHYDHNWSLVCLSPTEAEAIYTVHQLMSYAEEIH